MDAMRFAARSRAPAAALAALAGLLLGGLGAGCASTQEVRIDCVPEQVRVYVDGRLLEDSTDRVELRSDEPHKIFAKGPGYEPRLVVLEPRADADGRPTLGEGDVCMQLVPVGMGRELEIDVEKDVPVEQP